MTTFRLPTKNYRALPSPNGTSRLGVFFVPATSVSRDLWDWRAVNPREVNKRSSVYKNICLTLTQEPERFHERNRGITIVADSISYDDKRQEVILTLADNKLHGVVDGAHTLSAVLEAQQTQEGSYWPAHVFFKVVEGLDPEQIAEIAGGLNTSQQVDLKSLENLRSHFDELRGALGSESYADKIAYKMNEDKPIDVREILYYLAVFDAESYDDKRHPVSLFGRKEGIVRKFADQAADPNSGDSFRILISKAPEILRLRDMIEKKALAVSNIGRYNAGKGTRVRSESNRETPLHFLNETSNGRIPLGWIMPMLAAFRANVDWNRPKGTFSWIVPLDELVDSCIEQLVLGIKDVHEQENSRPEYVGRNSIAWRMSYNTVSEYILKKRLASLNAPQ
jgi:hypothetical protein